MVYIIENNIIDLQQIFEGVDYEYKYKYVFWVVVSVVDGDVLNEDFMVGVSINCSFFIIFDLVWVLEECYIVVFVYQGGGMLDVIQVYEILVIE